MKCRGEGRRGEQYFINLQRAYKTGNSGVITAAWGKILLLCNMVVEEGGVEGCWQQNQSTCAELGRTRQLGRENVLGRYPGYVLCMLPSAQQAMAAVGPRGAGWKRSRSQRVAACMWEGPAPTLPFVPAHRCI